MGGQLHASEEVNIPYIQYTKEITLPFIQECENKYQLDCIGTGGKFAKNVSEISLHFIAYRKGTIEEARNVEIKMIETLLEHINHQEKIRPFLDQYPFKPENLDIAISFRKNDDSCYSDGSVVLVFLARDKIFYRAEDSKTGKRFDLHEESYADALKIVNGKSSEVKKAIPLNTPKT